MSDVRQPPRKRTLAAVVGTAVAAAAISFTSPKEGVSLVPYNDRLADNLQTVCFGETKVAMRAYTMPECRAMLDASMAGYAQGVEDVTPGFDGLTVGQKVSAIDFSYNLGLASWRVSTVRRGYIAHDFPKACGMYMNWAYRTINRGTPREKKLNCALRENNCYGLYQRRRAEEAACLGN